MGRGTLRLLIGLVVLGAGIGKAVDVPGFVRVIETYRLVPGGGLLPVALVVIAAELVLGTWLLSGWRLVPAALGSVAMHLFWAALLALTLARGLDLPNCGCFGVFFARPIRWYSPLEDLAAAGLSWLLYSLARQAETVSSR